MTMSEEKSLPMPPEIAKSIVKVMGEVKKLSKDETNKHGGYKYVSVDQFFELVGRLMADAGIFDVVEEVESSIEIRETVDQYGKTKKSAWLSTKYEIFIYHESGAVYGPLHRQQQVAATGPQSYGASEAFVEKYFLRNLFKVSTGEKDADDQPQEGLPSEAKWSGRAGANAREEEDQAARFYVTQSKERFTKIEDIQQLREWWESQKSVMNDLFNGKDDPLYIDLRKAFADWGDELKKRNPGAEPSKLEKQLADNIPY